MVVKLGKLITISAKVSKELRKEAEALGINISEVIRRTLEKEVKEKKMQKVLKLLTLEVEKGPKLPPGTIVKLLREMREHS